jgi:hypothetical protein
MDERHPWQIRRQIMFAYQMKVERSKMALLMLVVVLLFGLAPSRVSAADDRTTFAYKNGSFECVSPGSWEEKRDDGTVSKFTEVTRTAAYVELYDKSRDMKVRLYSNVGKWYSEKDKSWIKWDGSEGSWK